jgi:hypothetical protein
MEGNVSKKIQVNEKPFKDLLLLNTFNVSYQKIKVAKTKAIASKSALEDEFNFTVSENIDAKIVTVDSTTFYNILIKREEIKTEYFENLVIKSEIINGIDQTSAYIVKYIPSEEITATNHDSFYFEGEKELTQLVGRYSSDCYYTCALVCHETAGDGPYSHSHSPTSDCSGGNITMECSTVCISGGGSGSGGGGGSNGDGGGGGGTSGGTSLEVEPHNDNGASEGDIVVVPVYDFLEDEEPRKDPCKELNDMTNKPIANTTKKVMDNLNELANGVTEHREKLYTLSPAYINSAADYSQYVENYSEGQLEQAEVQSNFDGILLDVIMHTHWSATKHLSTFSLGDLYQIYTSLSDSSIQQPESFTSIVITANNTKYALKFTDANAFITWGNTFFYGWGLDFGSGKGNPFIESKEGIYDKSINLANTVTQNEKGLAKFLTNQGIGLKLYRADNTFSQWTKLSVNLLGTFKETPCP